MTKSALVKIGLPSEQAEGVKRIRQVRKILEQHDAAIARLDAATTEKIREVLAAGEEPEAENTDAAATA